MTRIKDPKTGKFTNPQADKKYLDKNWLSHQYSVLNRTGRDIAKECNVDKTNIYYQLRKFGLNVRKNARDYALLNPKKYMDKAWLSAEYNLKPTTQIAREQKVSSSIICKWLDYYEIPIRNSSKRRQGKFHSRFKGTNWINSQGYTMVYSPNHPRLSSHVRPYVQEHILVMERHLGRFLHQGEQVHHINADKQDNRIENLQLFNSGKGHIIYEMILRDFAKKLLFGNLSISNRSELLELFNNFVKEQG